jgi:hypothetical protein
MKKFLILAAILLSSPAFAQQSNVVSTQTKPVVEKKKEYRPFRYETACALEANNEFQMDTCVVIETRETGGALRTRNIYSNRFRLTVKSWFDKEKGFMTWDSHNKFAYKFEYKVGGVDGLGAWSYVMPGVLLQNVSWD